MSRITITPVILKSQQHKDGKYPIKLRFTYKRRSSFATTNLCATEADLVPIKKGEKEKATREIKDKNLKHKIAELIFSFEKAAEDFDPYLFPDYSVTDVIGYLQKAIKKDVFRLDFPDFAKEYVDEKKKISSSTRSYRNYESAIKSLCHYFGREHFDISLLTSRTLREYEKWLVINYGSNARAVSLYTSHIATIHKAARMKFNTEELKEVLIRNPYEFYTPPKQNPSSHRDVEIDVVQGMINNYSNLTGRERIGVGTFLLSFATMGTNIPDLFAADITKDGLMHYFRQKTRARRKDGAEMYIEIPDCLGLLLKEYSDKSKPRKKVFNFHLRYSSFENLRDAAEKGIRTYREKNNLMETMAIYSARHTWATLARSKRCGIDPVIVDECLNHTSRTPMLDIYARKDFSIYWDANKKVLQCLDWSALL